MHINKSELISKIFINVLFISIFITIFFFTYISNIEKKIVINQMDFLSKDIKIFTGLFGKNINDTISNNINTLTIPDLSKEDKKVKENNNEIKKKASMFIILFTILILATIIFIYIKFNNNTYQLNEILSENIVILIAIGLIEYIFITYIAARYISINPSSVKLTILKSLRHKDFI